MPAEAFRDLSKEQKGEAIQTESLSNPQNLGSVEELLKELRAHEINVKHKISGNRPAGALELNNLRLNATGLGAISPNSFYLYSGWDQVSLREIDLCELSADGSRYKRLWDGKRAAEIHWGTLPDQRYLLFPSIDNGWIGESTSPNDGSRDTVVKHFRHLDGSIEHKYDDGRQIRITDLPKEKLICGVGSRPSENFVLHLSSNKSSSSEQNLDKSGFETDSYIDSKEIQDSRQRLLNLIDSRNTDQYTRFKLLSDMMHLESTRYKQLYTNFFKSGDPLEKAQEKAKQEIRETYDQASRILLFKSGIKDTKNNDTTPQSRLASACAEQIIWHAARPTEIDQGRHPTCSVANLQVRTFARHPGAAAAFIADLAFSQNFVGRAHGTVSSISPESLLAHQEARTLSPRDEERGIAGQIFQVGALNLMYAMHKPQLTYKQEEASDKAPKGDHLYDQDGHYENFPLNRDNWLLDAYEEIVGAKEPDWTVSQSWFQRIAGNGRAMRADSSHQLRRILRETAAKGNFPLSLTVDTRNDSLPKHSSQKDGNKNGGRHAISAYDYEDANTERVQIDNEWGSDNDRLGSRGISIEQTFDMMKDPDAIRLPQLPWEKPRTPPVWAR